MKDAIRRFSVLVLVVSFFIGYAWQVYAGEVAPALTEPDKSTKAKVSESYGNIPLSFIQNDGQMDKEVKFYERASGHTTYFTKEGIYLKLAGKTENNDRKSEVMKLTAIGGNKKPKVFAEGMQEGKVNYFIGSNQKKWQTNIPTYGAIVYEGIYKNIDMKFYGNNRQMEYDIIVKPGANPSKVQLSYEGIKNLIVTKDGRLEISMKEGTVIQDRPYCYQEINGKCIEVEGKFEILNKGKQDSGNSTSNPQFTYGFLVASYDKKHPLVIDPVLSYSTYLGGALQDAGMSIAVDAEGNAYVIGFAESSDFLTINAIQTSFGGGRSDVFITKLNSEGDAIVYSTFIGGTGRDSGLDVAVDTTGNVYIVGRTESPDFPTVNAIQPSIQMTFQLQMQYNHLLVVVAITMMPL